MSRIVHAVLLRTYSRSSTAVAQDVNIKRRIGLALPKKMHILHSGLLLSGASRPLPACTETHAVSLTEVLLDRSIFCSIGRRSPALSGRLRWHELREDWTRQQGLYLLLRLFADFSKFWPKTTIKSSPCHTTPASYKFLLSSVWLTTLYSCPYSLGSFWNARPFPMLLGGSTCTT